jgi:isopenicillin-N N-acyltransferase-like protein
MNRNHAPPYVEVGPTSHFGLGEAIGEHLRDAVREQCDKVLHLFLAYAERAALAPIAERILSRGSRVFPSYVEELRGMAVGAGVDVHELVLTCMEESVMTTLRERCTTIALADRGEVLLGHNEDWAPGYEDGLYVVQAELHDGRSFLSLAYTGSLPGSSVALNSDGIAFSGNSILTSHQPGLPKNLILRSQIEARTLEEFVQRATVGPRTIPNNTMAVDRAGRIVNVELGLCDHALHHAEGGYAVHTNHVLSEDLRHLDTVDRPCSKARRKTAKEMLSGAEPTKDLMKRILRSHDRWPHSVCLHAQSDHYDDSQTVASAIVDLSAMSMAVTKGPPCGSDYVTYRLKS